MLIGAVEIVLAAPESPLLYPGIASALPERKAAMHGSVTVLACLAGWLAVLKLSSAYSKHEQAPIIGANGTYNTHFSAYVRDLDPGECVIFEAQARSLSTAC